MPEALSLIQRITKQQQQQNGKTNMIILNFQNKNVYTDIKQVTYEDQIQVVFILY